MGREDSSMGPLGSALALGVTGGGAAFKDIRVRILR